MNDCKHPDYVPSIFAHRQQLTEGTVRLWRYKNARKREAGVDNMVLSAKRRRTRTPTEASPTEPTEASPTELTEDGALSDRPVSHRGQVAIAIEVANLKRERDEDRSERDAALQNWSKE